MIEPTDVRALEPLLDLARSQPDAAVRVAALEAAARFPLDEIGWFELSDTTGRVLRDLAPATPERRAALRVAARIPLLSVRRHLRGLADDPDDPDAATVSEALAAVGDPSQIRILADRVAAGAFERLPDLAAMPLEDAGLSPDLFPPPPPDGDPNLPLWYAVALARVGDCSPLDDFLTGRAEPPPLFWADPWTPYAALAAIRPIPSELRRHLLEALPAAAHIDDPERAAMAHAIVWACTGIADAEGAPLAETDGGGTASAEAPPGPMTGLGPGPMGLAEPDEGPDSGPQVTPEPAGVPDPAAAAGRILALFDDPSSLGSGGADNDLRLLEGLAPEAADRFVVDLLNRADACVRTRQPIEPLLVPLGNTIVGAVERLPATPSWPIGRIAGLYLEPGPHVLDQGQFAWLLARPAAATLIERMIPRLLECPAREDRLRLLELVGEVGDCEAGRGASPWRGAGPVTPAAPSRMALIDDEPEMAMRGGVDLDGPIPIGPDRAEEALDFDRDRSGPGLGPRASVSLDDLEEAAPPDLEEVTPEETADAGAPRDRREVNVQIRHGDARRTTFLAGAEQVIRCWIGLPETDRAATSGSAIPQIRPEDFPEAGLELEVQLEWNGQTSVARTRLPKSRTARTADCDLRIRIPAEERFVRANVAFLYGKRVFEYVQVEAAVLQADEEPRPRDELTVRVMVDERQVIDLKERAPCDATIVCDRDPERLDEDGNALRTALEFGTQGAARYSLSKTGRAVAFLNKELFIAEKNLVRARERSDAADDEPVLDAEDETVLDMLRQLAQHGAAFYNELSGQRFVDPGRRIRLINRTPDDYTPLEFVYDRGFPSSTARLCDGWRDALEGDDDECPCCGPPGNAAESGERATTICPLGFWSLRKVIERLDPFRAEPDDAERGDDARSYPSDERKVLPPIDRALFGASHRVAEEDRAETIDSLRSTLPKVDLVENWSEWRDAVQPAPIPLLVALPHHGIRDAQDYLEIGGDPTPEDDRILERGRLVHAFVNPDKHDPGPIVLLIGCETGAETATGYPTLARRFQQLHTSIVVGTLAKILGRHAAPVARELVSQLASVNDPEADFGTIMRRVRRRMLLKGYLMAMCLVALGDASWHLGAAESPPATPAAPDEP